MCAGSYQFRNIWPAQRLALHAQRKRILTRAARATTTPQSPLSARRFANIWICGIFAHGFARAWCDDCGHDYFMAYSCKGRGLIEKVDAKEMLAYQRSGFSVDAGVRIEADDRAALERLLRYCARPPFAMERLRKEGAALVYRCAKQ
jgi:hypothetical protein